MKLILTIFLSVLTWSTPLNQDYNDIIVPMQAKTISNVNVHSVTPVNVTSNTYNASKLYTKSPTVNVYGGADGMNIADLSTRQTTMIKPSISTSQVIAYGPGHTTGQDECYCGAKASNSNNKNNPPCNCGHWHWNGRWVHIADGQCPHNPDSKNYNAPIGNGAAFMILLCLAYCLFLIIKHDAKLDRNE